MSDRRLVFGGAAAYMARSIACEIFPDRDSRQKRDQLTKLLIAFAAEIQRAAVELEVVK